MSRRRSIRKKKKQEKPPPPMNPMSMERTMQDIHRLLDEQDFENEDEINTFMNNLMKSGPIPRHEAETDLERAQELMYEAWEVGGPSAISMAKKALKISPDCTDAYVLLAEEDARDIIEARDLYQKGVDASERVLGESVFSEDRGHFWGIIETRPYMRARFGLANVHWMLGYRDEAISSAQEMLRLNTDDNQGVRYVLAHWLLLDERNAELEQLFADYKDDIGVDLTYSRALYAYRREGDSRQSRKHLKEAVRWNKHVPDFLLQRKYPSLERKDYVEMGGEDEAIVYYGASVPEWQATPGALEWLARQTQ